MHIHSIPLLRYPRTPHLEGSRLQPDDDGRDQMPLSALEGAYVVLEEKLDGANSALSYSDAGEQLLQSRGHYLAGGARERQFNLFKTWATAHENAFLSVLEDRYVLYGEWMYAKHSVWYDRLPHYFAEFDVYDRATGKFLSTARRRELLRGLPVLPVPVLYEGSMPTDPRLLWALVTRSLAKSPDWRAALEGHASRLAHPLDLTWKQTDKSDKSEGLYLKVENAEEVLGRYKLVRADFTQTILDSDSHHAARPILPNLLDPRADIFSSALRCTWEDLGLQTVRGLDELHTMFPAKGRRRGSS